MGVLGDLARKVLESEEPRKYGKAVCPKCDQLAVHADCGWCINCCYYLNRTVPCYEGFSGLNWPKRAPADA